MIKFFFFLCIYLAVCIELEKKNVLRSKEIFYLFIIVPKKYVFSFLNLYFSGAFEYLPNISNTPELSNNKNGHLEANKKA